MRTCAWRHWKLKSCSHEPAARSTNLATHASMAQHSQTLGVVGAPVHLCLSNVEADAVGVLADLTHGISEGVHD